jgi:hypothetical protein
MLEDKVVELRLGLDHLLADGTDRHPELFGRRLQRAEPPDGFERTQTVQMHRVQISHAVFLYRRVVILN